MADMFGLDPSCRVYISLKDIIYSRELSDLRSILLGINSPDDDVRINSINALYKIPTIEEYVKHTNTNKDADLSVTLLEHVLSTTLIETVYVTDAFDDNTMNGIPIDDKPFMLKLSNNFFTPSVKESPNIYFLYDDSDKVYLDFGIEYFKDKMIHIETFIKEYKTYVSESGVTDILVGKNYINKYKDIIIPTKNTKVIMPEIDATIMAARHEYIPTAYYENYILKN